MPLDVVCPGCRERYHETTDTYDPEALAEPHMTRLKERYASIGWESYSPHAYGYGCMECPGCGAPYAPSGSLIIAEQEAAQGADVDEEPRKRRGKK